MLKVSQTYLVGFDLNDTGPDLSCATIFRYNGAEERYEVDRHLYGKNAEELYKEIAKG